MSIVKQGAKAAVPKLRFPEFHKAAAWDEKTLASVCDRITQGGTPDTSVASYWDGDVAWITPAEMGKSDDPHVGSTVRHITDEGLQACSSGLLPVHSVIISTRAPIGHLAINTVPMAINQGCKGIVPGSGLEYRFLLASLLLAKPRLNDLGAGNTFKELSASALKSFAIGVPSRAEQQKIADCLTSLDEVIAAQGRKVEALKAHKRGLMQQLFPREGETRPRLRFPEFRNAPEWEQHRLGDIASISKGKGISKADIAVEGRTPCIRYGELYTVYGEVIDRPLSRTDVPAAELVLSQAGDVLVPASGETKEDIATSAVVLGAGVALSSDLNIIRLDADGRFFSYYLNGAKRRALAKVAQGDTVVHLYPRQLEQLDVAIPVDKAEQQRIADCLSSLDTRIAAETRQLAALKTHKQGLMQQLFPVPEAAQA